MCACVSLYHMSFIQHRNVLLKILSFSHHILKTTFLTKNFSHHQLNHTSPIYYFSYISVQNIVYTKYWFYFSHSIFGRFCHSSCVYAVWVVFSLRFTIKKNYYYFFVVSHTYLLPSAVGTFCYIFLLILYNCNFSESIHCTRWCSIQIWMLE